MSAMRWPWSSGRGAPGGARRTARQATVPAEPTATGRPEPLRAADPERIADWQLLARLGAGATGVVYLARSPRGRTAALKAAHARHSAPAQEVRARFAAEVRAGRELASAGAPAGRFAPVWDADPDGPRPWLATAYVPGPTLRQAVTAHGPWPAAAVRRLGAELAAALVAVHAAGLVHRDVKPSNVLVAVAGPCLIDFGIARFPDGAAPGADAERTTAPGGLVGSPGYLAPELAAPAADAPAGPAGSAADVFALGAVLAFAATGEGPFGTGTADELLFRARHEPPRLAGVPDEALRATLARCLQPAPEGRPTAGELLAALRPDPRAGIAAPPTPPTPPAPAAPAAPATAPEPPVAEPPPTGPFATVLPGPVLADAVRRTTRDAALPAPLRDAAPGAEPPAERQPGPARRALLTLGGALAVAGVSGATYAAGRATRGEEAAGSPGHTPQPTPSPTRDPGAPPEALWQQSGVGDMRGPVLAGETLVTSGYGGTMRGIDTTDGSVLWSLPESLTRVPMATEDGAHLLLDRAPGGLNDLLGVVEPHTGRLRASAPLGELTTHLRQETPVIAVDGHTAFVAGHEAVPAPGEDWTPDAVDEAESAPTPLVAYDIAADEVRWRRTVDPLPGDLVPATVVGGLLVVLAHDAARAYDVRDGEPAWEYPYGAALADPGYLSAPELTVVATPDEGVLLCGNGLVHLDGATGEVRWTAEPGDDPEVTELSEEYGPASLFVAPRVVRGSTAYLNVSGRQVRALDLDTHQWRWTWEAPEEFRYAPVVVPEAGGLVFPQPYLDQTTLLALDAETGEELWEVRDHDGFGEEAFVVADAERVYVQRLGTIRAFPLEA